MKIQLKYSDGTQRTIGSGRDADGNPDGSDDWDHPSAAAARQITADLGMEWDFTTWENAKLLAHKSIAE